ncbi:hypothetical protein NQ015_08015 [Corynebacterium sp. 153RC1]|uniref:hypothetical protein n=1 Tax=unclassified Corynebacterium TaxID=2624378 RepID=UPI00211C9AA2|nr:MULTISPECIES: hypothetical protein [unclassified Corynebacterium]MCQ9353498.1 hypothetical protein [Corynebacterium sp. 209RC1]MCQ9355191.1 hypothetical protein [Corynebacterium sp. 1222RC1]MCQ9361708.1 hypothetical protein [Corynebacterium sp. 153RC1]MCQ9363914.1 hypothetical protein [Corynebacterium sp. 732RC1]MCQ9365697.1 hypothetical protein [Corynebacterium sp. 70RC1]
MPVQVPTSQVPVVHLEPEEPGELVVWLALVVWVAQVLKQKVRRGLLELKALVAQPELQAPEKTEVLEARAVQILWARQVLRLPVEQVEQVALPVLVGWPGLVAPRELPVEQVGPVPKQMEQPELPGLPERQERQELWERRVLEVLGQEAR